VAHEPVATVRIVFSPVDQHGSNASQVGGVLVAALLSGLTAYAAKQSGGHREREVRNRRLELELTAFGPFTDSLSDPEKARLIMGRDSSEVRMSHQSETRRITT
jgi:hypothetical protein